MRTGLIIPQPLYYFSKEFLTNLIEKNKQYHLCFVKGAYTIEATNYLTSLNLTTFDSLENLFQKIS